MIGKMMKKHIVIHFGVILSILWLGIAQAKAAPDVMLKQVTQQLVGELRSQDALLKRNPNHIYTIINTVLVPHLDWSTMSKWVLGRQVWMNATVDQKRRFTAEFRELLIRTYASTLQAYNNQTIEYLPLRSGYAGRTRVQIESRILEPGREPIRVSYRLADRGNAWQVYDISIEGVSLLKGFQQQFAEEMQKGGVEHLIQTLARHNRKQIK